MCVCVGGCISICVGGCISGCISRCMCIYIYEQTAYEDHVAGVGSEQRKNKNKNKNKNKTPEKLILRVLAASDPAHMGDKSEWLKGGDANARELV